MSDAIMSASMPTHMPVASRGVYFLANDMVIELAVAFLNSFRTHNPAIDLCLIPYDDEYRQVAALQDTYRFSIFADNAQLATCDEISRRFHGRTLGAYRKLAAWEGKFEQFVYIDLDTIVLASVDFVFRDLSHCPLFTSHSNIGELRQWVWKDSIFEKRCLTREQIDYSANTGFIVSIRMLLPMRYVLSRLDAALELKDDMVLMCMEQPFLNYLFVTAPCKYGSIYTFYVTAVNRNVKVEWWAGSPGGIVDGGRFHVPDWPPVLLVHWAGLWQADHGSLVDIPYKALWDFYRHLPHPPALAGALPAPVTRLPGAGFSLAQSTYSGPVSELMRFGAAKPFVQPWYTPIPCAPANTGMPMGGIGNAFTLTPAGTTPALSFLNGLHVTAPPHHSVKLRNLFFAERAVDARLIVGERRELVKLAFLRPLLRADGEPWIGGHETQDELDAILAAMQDCSTLYQDNRAALARWSTALSVRTRRCLAAPGQVGLSRELLLDMYSPGLALAALFQGSLTADTAGGIISGQRGYPAQHMAYRGLYPLCKTVHAAPAHRLAIKVHSFSPVVSNDPKGCSLPVSVTHVTVHNPGTQAFEASLAWTLENLCGNQVVKARPGMQDAWFEMVRTAQCQTGETFSDVLGDGQRRVIGITLAQAPQGSRGDIDGAMTLALAYDGEADDMLVSAHPAWYAAHENRIVAECLASGRVAGWRPQENPTGREPLAGALCATFVVPPGTTRTLRFSLALDFPGMKIGTLSLEKKYVGYFPSAAGRSARIALHMLAHDDHYAAAIASDHAGQAGLGRVPGLLAAAPGAASAAQFQTMLANHLGFLADSSLWDRQDRCWIRECADYPFFNSLDVYFYGSFSLLRLLPELDAAILRDYSRAVLAADPTPRRYREYCDDPLADLREPRAEGPRGVRGAVPHDMGSPFDAQPDAYSFSNVKHWKDLAPKYILLVLRQYRTRPERAFLAECWAGVAAAVGYLVEMVPAGANLPFTDGYDDTFDNIPSYGIAVYAGTLWIAALAAAAAIADVLGEQACARDWRVAQRLARRDLEHALWSEDHGCYRFYSDPRSGRHSDNIFADQLLADLWLDLLDLPPLTPPARRVRIVETVTSTNFRRHSPAIGAANLCAPDGSALASFQERDVWTGVQYSLAAAAFSAGRGADAWDLIDIQYENLYRQANIPFAAPEGFTMNGGGRLEYTAGRYLRPGMIWVFAALRAG
jgi:non-lysosomal glucosylceramidase